MRDMASTIAWCVHEAVEHDLPAVHFAEREIRGHIRAAYDRRPHHVDHSIEVHAWEQSWANTAMGMGGMAGQAITHAPTVVVIDMSARVAAVYVSTNLRGLVSVDIQWMEMLAERRIIQSRFPFGTPYPQSTTGENDE